MVTTQPDTLPQEIMYLHAMIGTRMSLTVEMGAPAFLLRYFMNGSLLCYGTCFFSDTCRKYSVCSPIHFPCQKLYAQ